MTAAAPTTRPRALWTPWHHKTTEAFVVGLWFWTTAVEFPGQQLLLYSMAGYFMAGCYFHWREVSAIFRQGWLLILLPLWAILSTIWSMSPNDSLRLGAQLLFSVIICMYAAARLERRHVIFVVFVALAWYAFRSAPDVLSGKNIRGVFNEKNMLASRMSVMAFAGVTIFLSKEFPALVRWGVLPFVALGLLLVVMATSATAIITGFMGLLIIIGFALVWRPARGYRALIVTSAVTLGLLAAFIIAQDPSTDLVSELFNAFGKDKTLTGRTQLWDYAIQQIQQKPFLGTGAGGFWRQGSLEAQTLLDLFYKPRWAHFSFHNSYLELTVNMGLIGLALALAGLFWVVWVTLRQFFVEAPATTAFFAAMTLVALSRSFVEADLWRQFEPVQMMVWMGALFAARDLAARREKRQAPPPSFTGGP